MSHIKLTRKRTGSTHLASFLLLTIAVAIMTGLSACTNSARKEKNTAAITSVNEKPVACDTFIKDIPPVKDYRKALSVWLEGSPLEWFLKYRQSAWREAKAWNVLIIPIDSNPVLQCVAKDKEDVFLYIPNHFFITKKGGDYFRFFIVNNSMDTLRLRGLDDVIDSISSSVSYVTGDTHPLEWLSYQKTSSLVECGNSIWTVKLPPKSAIESEIESQYLNLGDKADTLVNYRLELSLRNRKFLSNTIPIHLMKRQLPYLGNKFD